MFIKADVLGAYIEKQEERIKDLQKSFDSTKRKEIEKNKILLIYH